MSKVKPKVHQILLGLNLLLPLVRCSTDLDHQTMYTYEGRQVTLHCFAARRSTVSWWWSAHRSHTSWMKLKENKYTVSNDFNGTPHTHVITNVRLDDAGRYLCVDREGNEGCTDLTFTENKYMMSNALTGTQHTQAVTNVRLDDTGRRLCIDYEGNVGYTDLIVTGSQLKCESSIDKEHQRDIIKMKCTIIYKGKSNPYMEWSLVRNGSVFDGLSLEKHVRTKIDLSRTYSVITSEITLPAAKWPNRSSLKCQLVESRDLKHNPVLSDISWLSDNIATSCTDTEDCYIDIKHADVIENDKAVFGITILDGIIYLLLKDRTKLELYNSHNLESLDYSTFVPGLITPVDVCSSAYDKTVYISDNDHNSILKIDVLTKGTNHLMMHKYHEPRRLSVTKDNTLIVTVWFSNTEGESGLVKYTSDGELVIVIRFDASIQYAHQTVQLSRNRLAVSHGNSEASLHRVCVVNNEGKIVKTYGDKPGADDDKLNSPMSLAVDRDSKQIFVADMNNNRIILLDFNLMYQGQVGAQLDIKMPMSIFWDPATKRLLIGEYGGRVHVTSR